MPYFAFSLCVAGPWSISREQPLSSRYRVVAFDGELSDAALDRLWDEFAHPVQAEVGR